VQAEDALPEAYLPAEHWLHTVAATTEYSPTGHVPETEERPDILQKKPEGHAKQETADIDG
jgi:hypothetical protein